MPCAEAEPRGVSKDSAVNSKAALGIGRLITGVSPLSLQLFQIGRVQLKSRALDTASVQAGDCHGTWRNRDPRRVSGHRFCLSWGGYQPRQFTIILK
jgi:hypothetical protein